MNNDSKPKDKKPKNKVLIIFGIIFGIAIATWLTLTVIVPLVKGTSVNKYSGVQREIADNIVDLAKLYNGPQSPSPMPRFMYQVSIDDIHPVTAEEIEKYCKDDDPLYISNDPANARYYTAVVTEHYLFTLPKTTKYVGCDPTDYIHVQVFGTPKEIDTRTRIPFVN